MNISNFMIVNIKLFKYFKLLDHKLTLYTLINTKM